MAFINFVVKVILCFSLWINFNKESYRKKEKQMFESRKSHFDSNFSTSAKLDKGRFSVAKFFSADKSDKNPFRPTNI